MLEYFVGVIKGIGCELGELFWLKNHTIWQHWKIGIVKSDSIHHFLENASTNISVVNKTKKRPLFPYWKLNAAQVIRNIEMKLTVSQTLRCTIADDIPLFFEKKGYYDKKAINLCITVWHIYNKYNQTVVSIHAGFLTNLYHVDIHIYSHGCVSFLLIKTGYISHVFFFHNRMLWFWR
jgi:hypothetical protein